MEKEEIRVMVKADKMGRITAISSSEFIGDETGWQCIDAGTGDRYMHAQRNYLPEGICDARGVCRYKLEGGAVKQRTQEEMDADAPEQTPTSAQRLAALEAQSAMLTECILEMSEMIYA